MKVIVPLYTPWIATIYLLVTLTGQHPDNGSLIIISTLQYVFYLFEPFQRDHLLLGTVNKETQIKQDSANSFFKGLNTVQIFETGATSEGALSLWRGAILL